MGRKLIPKALRNGGSSKKLGSDARPPTLFEIFRPQEGEMAVGKKKEIWIKGSEKIELYRSTERVGNRYSLAGRTSVVKFRKTVYDARFDRTVWVQTAFDGCDSMLLNSARKTLTELGFVRYRTRGLG